jgi:hypothetical protein
MQLTRVRLGAHVKSFPEQGEHARNGNDRQFVNHRFLA